jgi:hypothetical protein
MSPPPPTYSLPNILAATQYIYDDQLAFGIAGGYKGTPDGRKRFGRVHREIIELKRAHNRRSIVITRGHGKSTLESVIGPAYALLQDPGDRILLASAERSLAAQLLGESRDLLAGDLEVMPGMYIPMRELFPWTAPMFPSGPRSGPVEQLNVAGRKGTPGREPSVMIGSPETGMAGRHPRRAILDDPTNEKTSKTQTQCDKAIRFVEQLIPLMYDYASPILHIGTPWAFWDVTAFLGEQADWNQVRYGVLDGPDGGPLCPSFLNMEEIIDIRDNKVSPEFWSMQYLCVPSVGDTGLFYAKDVERRRWPDDRPLPAGQTLMLVDPVAVADGTSNDRNGMLKVRVVPNGSLPADQQAEDCRADQNIFIVFWADEMKGNADEAVKRMEDLAPSVQSIWIENVVFSGLMKPWLRDRGRMGTTRIRRQKIPTSALPIRLAGFPTALRKGIVRFAANGYHGQQLLESRLLQYPKAPFDDLPAALALLGTHLDRRGALPLGDSMDEDGGGNGYRRSRDIATVPGLLERMGEQSAGAWFD